MADLITIKHNIPKSIISEQDIQAAVDKATKAGAERVAKTLNKTVSTWENPPVFSVKKTSGGHQVVFDARTKGGKEFEWVSGGVKPHPIPNTPNPDKPMTFVWTGKGNYPAKSHLGSLNAYVGMSSKRGIKNLAWVRMYQLMHPGIWPRDFAQLIMNTEKDRVLKDIMRLVAKLPKHGMYGPRLEK